MAIAELPILMMLIESAIYEVNVLASVLVCVDIYLVLLPHILAWSYPLLFSGGTTSV